MKGVKLRPVHQLVYTAVLIALTVLLNRLVGLAQVGPLFSFARIAPGTSLILFGAVLLGPFHGLLIAVAADAIGWLILGQWTGTFNFFLSIFYALAGAVPYFVGRLFTGEKTGKVAKYAFLPLFGLLFVGAILAIWLSPSIVILFQKASLEVEVAKIVFTVVLCLGALLTVGSYFALRRLSEKMVGGFSVEAAFGVALSYEVVACFLKPLAFILFYSLILGQSFRDATGFSYGSLVAFTAMFALMNVPLNAYLLSLYCRYGNFLIRGHVHEEKR